RTEQRSGTEHYGRAEWYRCPWRRHMMAVRPSPAALFWSARQVVRQHEEPPDPDRATGCCAQCTPDGCPLLDWARLLLAPSVHEPAMPVADMLAAELVDRAS